MCEYECVCAVKIEVANGLLLSVQFLKNILHLFLYSSSGPRAPN